MKQIIIKTCKECKYCNSNRDYTSDSWEVCFRFDCTHPLTSGKNIARYVDWYANDPEIPEWCPR